MPLQIEEGTVHIDTAIEVWVWMRMYQDLHGHPPTLREIRDAMASLNYPSSVRHSLQLLVEQELVAEVKPENVSRRYLALDKT